MPFFGIHPEDPAAMISPFSSAISAGGLVFCSGQIGIDPKSRKLFSMDIEAQLTQAVENLGFVLETQGCTLDDTTRLNVYLLDLNDLRKVDDILVQYFTNRPSRTVLGVSALPSGAKVMLDVIALIPSRK